MPLPGVGLEYLQRVLLSKFVSKETDPATVRRDRAIDKWLAQESTNAETNRRLSELHEEYNILPRVTWERFRGIVQGYVLRLLGDVPPVDALVGSYSGGASTSRKRTEGHPALKYTGQAHSTSAAWDVYSGVVIPSVPGISRNVAYHGSLIGFTLVPSPEKEEKRATPSTRRRKKDQRASQKDTPSHNNLLTRRLHTVFSDQVPFKGRPRAVSHLSDNLGVRGTCEIVLVRGNEMFTVPKDTTIDRVACKEPDINMFLQKGVGDFIRRKLRMNGIDLNDQTRNQELARMGSISGDLATVDLSSASDSVTTELVHAFLPPLWSSLLDDIRSPVTRVRGEDHVNEMYSSMGNGFTFELESLLFWAVARAVCYVTNVSGTVSVYGDDLILPSDAYHDLEWVFRILGFKVNPEKSFWSGPFRESCGGHYHNGHDITPFYLRKPIERLTDLIQILNQIRKWSDQSSVSGILDPTLEGIWNTFSQFVPRCFWGGHDYNSIYQLVSPGRPRKRLVELQEDPEYNGIGGYVMWLNTLGDGQHSEGVETSFRSRVVRRCRSKSVRHYGNWRPISLFESEVSTSSTSP